MIAAHDIAGDLDGLLDEDLFRDLCPLSLVRARALLGPAWRCVGLDMHIRGEQLLVRFRFRPAWVTSPTTPAFLGWTP